MAEHTDTQPLDMRSLFTDAPADLPANRDIDEPVSVEPDANDARVPEPAVVRAVLVAVVGLVGAVVGKTLHADWIDPAVTLYAIVAPLALGFWIRRHVTPVAKK